MKSFKCNVCLKLSTNRCAKCLVVYYCSLNCQNNDCHAIQCSEIVIAHSKLVKEANNLRNLPGDMFFPINVFETSVGHFWGIEETRNYLLARFFYSMKLADLNTEASIQISIDNLKDILRLNLKDNLNVKLILPFLILRFPGREQECYEFICWVFGLFDAKFDSNDLFHPSSNTTKENNSILLSPNVNSILLSPNVNLSEVVCICLIKLRFYLKLQHFYISTKTFLRGTLHRLNNCSPMKKMGGHIDELKLIRDFLTPKMLSSFYQILPNEKREPKATLLNVITELRFQVITLMKVAEMKNCHIWEALINPLDVFSSPPPKQIFGLGSSEEELNFVIRSILPACELDYKDMDYGSRSKPLDFIRRHINTDIL